MIRPVTKHSPAISGHEFKIGFPDRALVQGGPQVPLVLLKCRHVGFKLVLS